jgi:hypothetical protein
MRMRLLPGMAGLCLMLAVLPVRAADPKPAAPGIVVRMKSLDALLDDAKYLAELAGKSDDFKQYEGLFKSVVGEKGFEGVDTKKPLGAYGFIGAQGIDSKIVILLPIADEKAFLNFLKSKDMAAEKQEDGSYKANAPNANEPVVFRFANKYVYATRAATKDAVEPKNLLDPAMVLPVNPTSLLSVMVDIDKIPAELKKVAVGQSANGLAGLKDMKDPNETDAQHLLQVALLDEMADWTKMVLNESGAATLSLDLDRQKGDLSLSLGLAGKPGTKLAKTFADLGAARSVGAGLVGKDSAMNFLLHVSLPERLRKPLEPVIDEGVKKALEEEKDKDKRAVGEKAYKVLAPTLKSGELDLGMNIRGPSSKGKYAMVMAFKVKDGSQIDKLMNDLVKDLPEKERKNVTLNFAKMGSINIHKVEGGELDKDAREMFGEGPAFFAVRDDAVMMAIGDGAMEALKEALTAKPGPSKAMQFEMSMSRMLKALPMDQRKLAQDAAKKAFALNPDADKLTLVLEGGKSLKLTFHMKAALVTFFNLMAEGEKKID